MLALLELGEYVIIIPKTKPCVRCPLEFTDEQPLNQLPLSSSTDKRDHSWHPSVIAGVDLPRKRHQSCDHEI